MAGPGGEDEALRAVLAELGDLILLEDSEGLGRVVGAEQVSGIEDVAEVVAGETVGACVPSVEFGAERRGDLRPEGRPPS